MIKMRPCIKALTPNDAKASYSLAKLAYSNEVTGVNMFKCSTIKANGWCLGGSCPLFNGDSVGVTKRSTVSASSLPTSKSVSPKARRLKNTRLGLKDPSLDAETRDYWAKLMDVKGNIPPIKSVGDDVDAE